MEYLLGMIGWVVSGIVAWVTAYGGARAGAVEADRLAQRQREQETAAKRSVLCEALRFQMAAIPDEFRPYVEGTIPFRPSIKLPALSRLLDGETLQYSTDAELLTALLNLQVGVSVHNDFVTTINLTQYLLVELPDGYRSHL